MLFRAKHVIYFKLESWFVACIFLSKYLYQKLKTSSFNINEQLLFCYFQKRLKKIFGFEMKQVKNLQKNSAFSKKRMTKEAAFFYSWEKMNNVLFSLVFLQGGDVLLSKFSSFVFSCYSLKYLVVVYKHLKKTGKS